MSTTRRPGSRLGIELLSVFGLDPVAHVHLAADLGCSHISTGLTSAPYNPHGYAPWSLREDPALRRAMSAAMRDRGITVSLGEGFGVRPGVAMGDLERDLDLMADLGTECIGGVGMEPDTARGDNEFALLIAMAGERGMTVTIEFVPGLPIGTLDQALALIRRIGRNDFRLNVDAMHYFRSGGDVARLLALDPALIGYAQLCDVPRVAVEPDYMREASFDRRAPGDGELPLADFVASLPLHVTIGLEVPMMALAADGIPPLDRMRPAVAAAKLSLGERPIDEQGNERC